MSTTSLQFRRLDPLLTEEQWLRIGSCLAISQRELEILKLVFEDEKERTIALRLQASQHTVHTHLKHLYWKLGVNSRAGLVVRVFREYLADTEQDKPVLPRLMSPPSLKKAA